MLARWLRASLARASLAQAYALQNSSGWLLIHLNSKRRARASIALVSATFVVCATQRVATARLFGLRARQQP